MRRGGHRGVEPAPDLGRFFEAHPVVAEGARAILTSTTPILTDPPATAGLLQAIRPSEREIARARRKAQAKAAAIGLLGVLSYAGLVLAPVGLALRFVCFAALLLAIVATATSVMHDANHAALTRWRWPNRLLGYTADLLGASSWLWRFKHNQLHHGNTNVVGVDSDVSQPPFARLAPAQRWRPWHRYQHVYLWFLYGFLAMKWLVVADFSNLARRRVGEQPLPRQPRAGEMAMLVLGKLAHVTWALLIPLMLFPWWIVLACYLVGSWIVGFTLAVIFQVAHCVGEAEMVSPDAPRRGADFELHQLRTTVDVRCRIPGVRWVFGGLDHQVEHHLAPRLPHTIHPLLARRLRALCAERGITYRLHPGVWSAVRSHGRWLKAMGRQAVPAAPAG